LTVTLFDLFWLKMSLRVDTWVLVVAGCLFASGCAIHRVKEKSAVPAVAVIPEFEQYVEEASSTEDWSVAWWRSFGDTALDELIEKGLDSSFDLQRFAARIEQASALASQAGARLYPTVDLTASDEYQWDGETVASDTRDRQETTRLGFLFRWELDFFGRLSSARKARLFQREASIQDWLDARLLLSTAIAERYFDIKETRRQLEVLGEQIVINESLLKLTTLRFGQGQSSVVAVLQQREQLDETKARVPEIEARIGQLQYTLDALLGLVPGTGSVILDSNFSDLPSLPEIGIPASLLQRRHDLRAIQQRVLALDANVGEALAEQLPAIRIGGGLDWRGDPTFGDEITSAFASLAAPLFAAGERRSEVRRRKAALDEALASYTDQFLSALVEVESALLLERKLVERLELVEAQLDTAQRLLDESRNRFSQGLTDYLPVFTSLNIVQVLERDVVSSRKEVLSSRVALHRALGGPILDPEVPGLVSLVNE
jgi:NodT family efflux transporter outer membrane factor (OMF) lipoprotein